ncbi:MAG: phosphomannomutase/phosphoglucomutase [Firmicutes bacterium]|nr:phosphomannomutase/phosphoglucomutase [Bacillota bacterium]
MATNFKKLQNGSDIRGVALEGIPGEAVNLTEEAAWYLTMGFVHWLAEKTGKCTEELTVSIGHDSRLSAGQLKEAAITALTDFGVTVYDCCLASTPAMFMSTVFEDYKCDGAIMITASHLPFNRNGFKYFDKDGGLNKADIKWITEWAENRETRGAFFVEEHPEGTVIQRDLIGTYSAYLRKKIIDEVAHPEHPELPLKGMKIVVDAGNGAGGFYSSRILAPLGADVSGSQFLEPDGTFPNHQPNPENKEAMASISSKVLETGADFGLIFDTDVDRSSAVDRFGKEISRNAIVAMAAALICKEHPGTTVVTDSITSDQLTVYLEECLGLKHLRFKRGYKNVINKSMELNAAGIDSQLAIETSGHAAYKENYFLDDGAYLATKIVIKAAQLALQGETIDVLLSSLEEPKEAKEVRFPIEGENFGEVGAKVLEDLKTWAEDRAEFGVSVVEPNYEGVRLNFRSEGLSGWCLLRKSLHDPILPLNVEVTEGECIVILEEIKAFLRNYDQVVVK